MGIPHAREVGEAKAVILGIPFDCGLHPVRMGARMGPAAIREQSPTSCGPTSLRCGT